MSATSSTAAPAARSFDVSRVPEGLGPATTAQVWRHCGASALLFGAALLVLALTPWPGELLRLRVGPGRGLDFYYAAYAAYLLLAPPIFLLTRPASLWQSKNLALLGLLRRCGAGWLRPGPQPAGFWRPSHLEQQALAFFLIKLFYGPLMVNSAILSWREAQKIAPALWLDGSLWAWWEQGYLLLIQGVFLLDSLLFVIGYHTETGWLRNRLRAAETNPWRLVICLGCYAPFNLATCALFGASYQDFNLAVQGSLHHPLAYGLRALSILALLLLISASLSLFTKASNLTNRGIVDWGPYRFIRHPGYLAKNCFWLLTAIPLFFPNRADPLYTPWVHARFCIFLAWGVLGWGMIYYLRARAEEAFLGQDPDYQAYCRKVKWRFIPGLH